MRTNYNVKKILSTIVVVGILSSSCKKFVEVPEPQDQMVSSDVFLTEQTAVSAVTSLYSQMMRGALYFSNAGMSIYPALSADELYNTTTNADLDLFTTNSLVESNGVLINNFWVVAYKNVYQANAVIEGLEKSTSISSTVKSQLISETKFIRAFTYFYLVNIFGDVPLLLTTDHRINSIAARTAAGEVYNQIIKDLQDAQNGMPESYPSIGRVRANKWAAASLLARVFLYMEKWVDAETIATNVINSGVYSIVPDPNNLFLTTSNETILQFYPVIGSSNTSHGTQFIPSSATARPTYGITNFLLNAFEASDARKGKWTKAVTVSGQNYVHPFKYKVRTGTTITENNVVLRLAEQYLIRAEARVRQNKITEAKTDIDKIRNRAGLANTTANTNEALLLAIAQERRIELFAEWGHRWLDLKRTQTADAVLSIVKGSNWQPTDKLYPIPEEELKRNPFLIQNPGY